MREEMEAMAEIIDFDFYRKFRIILPIRSRSLAKNKSLMVSRTPTKQYRRRRRSELISKIKKEE
jgi:hypothetical protein